MSEVRHPGNGNNILDFATGKTLATLRQQRIIRLAPEYDNLCILYSNNTTDPNKLYTMRIVCWALRADGEIVAMVPWLNRLVACTELTDPETGQWEGFFNPATEDVFYEVPDHKVLEIEGAAAFFGADQELPKNAPNTVVQEIPDTVGTHAMLVGDDEHTLVLTEVLSWRLYRDGSIQAMLIDEHKVESTPILAGDPCLYPVDENPAFKYFFQHNIANQIKAEDPAALAAIAMLFDS